MNVSRTILSLGFILKAAQLSFAAQAGNVLTNAADVHHLSRQAADHGLPVKLKANVTYSDPAWSVLFVRDNSGGVYVSLSGGPFPTNTELVEITGQTQDGSFLPVVTGASWRHLGVSSRPEARPIDQLERSAAQIDCEWCELIGVVRGVSLNSERNHFQLDVVADGWRTEVFIPTEDETLVRSNELIDATVRILGVAGIDYDRSGNGLKLKVFVPGLDFVRLTERASGDPFQRPLVPLSKLSNHAGGSSGGQPPMVRFPHRTHIRGLVTYLSSSAELILQEEDSAIRVQLSAGQRCELGESLEAVGFVNPGVFSPVMEDAFIRPTNANVPVRPVNVGPAKVLWGDYDARLVSLSGILQDLEITQTNRILKLLEDGVLFGASLNSSEASSTAQFQKGNRIRVTGICAVQGTQRAAPQSFQVLLRSPTDALDVPLRREFSAQQVLLIVAGVAACGSVVLLWGILLRRRVQERTRELASSLSLLHATIESIAEGILVVDRTGKVAGYNTSFVKMWRLPPEAVASKDDKQILDLVLNQVKDSEAFLGRVRELYAQPESESFDVLECKDGRVFERYSQAQRLNGQCVGRVWCFRDTTARKQSEAKLAAVHQELLETSRRVGMAEVASAVLHNVGNVLNSVNVSATLVNDRLQRSRANNLAQAAQLLQARMDDLHAFLTQDPKGEMLRGYLKDLSGNLLRENDSIRQEVQTLRRNIEHIKTIVAMQQSYARVSGTLEKLDPKELMENAVQINGAAYERDQIQLIREYHPVPEVLVDRHKVLQILINLLSNARHALAGNTSHQRRVSLSIFSPATGRVCLRVSDNGSGIEPQNLSRIFSQGFTTRQNGHGFGLHSGANAAKEMNGAISVQSAGPGHGAAFTLELPITNETSDKPKTPAA